MKIITALSFVAVFFTAPARGPEAKPKDAKANATDLSGVWDGDAGGIFVA